MIGAVPIVTFDTSAHNRVADDPRRRSVVNGINAGLWFRFAGLSIEELYATSQQSERESLLASCRSLQSGPSECLLPPNKLTEQLVMAHHNDPEHFDWRTVNVRWPLCEDAIRDRQFFDDEETSRAQPDFQKERKRAGRDDLVALRPEIQAIFESNGESPPTTFRPALSRLEAIGDGGSLLYAARRLYERAVGSAADKAMVREFMDCCPSFRALVYAIFVPWYNIAVRDFRFGEKLSAGNNDLFMSMYLPYCDWFVTDDKGQATSLREVAAHAGLETDVLMYDEFCGSLLATV